MGGSNTAGSGQAGAYGSRGIPEAGNVPSARTHAVNWTDGNGKLWLFGGKGYDATGTSGTLNDLWQFDPLTRQWAWMGGSSAVGCDGCGVAGVYGTKGVADVDNIPGSRSQSIGWTDRQGNLWLLGGNGYDGDGTQGILDDLWEFLPSTMQWAWMGGNGTVPGAGRGWAGIYGEKGIPSTGSAPGGRDGAAGWTDDEGNLWLLAGAGYDALGTSGSLNDLWVYQPSSQSLATAAPELSLGTGTYTGAQTVTITDATPGSIIYYMLDGSEPGTGSSVYSGPITVSTTTTLKAMAVAKGYMASATTSATYTFGPDPSFTIALRDGAPRNVSVQQGGTATYDLVVTPNGSSTFTSSINLLASGLPAGSIVTFTPSSVAAGMGATNVVLTVQTASTSAAVEIGRLRLTSALCLLLTPLLGLRRDRRKQRSIGRILGVAILLFAGLVTASGCSGFVLFKKPVNPIAYNITVTAATANIQKSTTITLTVD